MRLVDLGPLPLTLIASLTLTVVLLAIRVFILQRIQQQRQRENRQETERLKSLVAAYRSLAGSFTPAATEHGMQLEETLSDIVLFGTLIQVEMAARCIAALKRGEPVDYQPLVLSLRADLRRQLGLEQIPPRIELPAAGPGRPGRSGRDEGGNRAAGGRGGGIGGGSGAAAGAGGLSAGLVAGDAAADPP